MKLSRRLALNPVLPTAGLVATLLLFSAFPGQAEEPAVPAAAAQVDSQPASACEPSRLDSPYIPVDSWVYPAIWRLYALDFVDTVYLGMRPYTRSSVDHMLEEAGAKIEDADPGPATDEAQGIYEALMHELHSDEQGPCMTLQGKSRVESIYSVERGISGTPLRDSFHLGSTIVNDYGRPYQHGFNDYSGASGYAAAGRFLIYARGEFQAAPSGTGYSTGLAQTLASTVDITKYFFNNTCAANGSGPTCVPLPLNLLSTIPLGPISSITDGRWVEAYVSAHVLNHEVSFGKQDDWLGPGLGAGMAYSNNAENIYSFRINRIEPLHVPVLSYLTGPFRYEFLVGSLKGHTYPNDPWMHVEKVSFRPTENLEFGFERSVIWGGKGHVPITIHSFLKSFFSFQNVPASEKFSRNDPGARFGSFDFNYRLPFVRNWLSLYSDSEAHDDVNPISAPRRSAVRPGIYLSHFPVLTHLDLRVEGASTDPVSNAGNGDFLYYETVQRQGVTNKGFIFADWIGRDSKGGQAWLTYHLSPSENIQFMYRNAKADKSFIPDGTTQNDYQVSVVKRVMKDIEIRGWVQREEWKAPIYKPGQQSDTLAAAQITWFPKASKNF